jgi:hypothetical protein
MAGRVMVRSVCRSLAERTAAGLVLPVATAGLTRDPGLVTSRAVVWVVVAAGCRFEAGITASDANAPGGHADANGDSGRVHDVRQQGSDAPLPACAGTTPSDDFTTSPFCATWAGTTVIHAMGNVMSNDLVMMLMPNMSAPQVDCYATQPVAFPTDGVFVAAPSPIGGSPGDTSTEYTYFHAYSSNGAAETQASFVVKAGDLSLRDDNTQTNIVNLTYDSAMLWWRLRPDPAGGVAGDISADGMTWTKIGVVTGTAPAMIYVDIGAGADGAITTPATAKLSSLDICP